MDFDHLEEIDEARARVETCDAISLYFPRYGRALVVDFRCSPLDPPLVRVLPIAESVAARARMLGDLRPRLGAPESLATVRWERAVASAKEQGLWQAIAERAGCAGGTTIRVQLERAYRELVGLELHELRQAIAGDGYRTVWGRLTAR